MNLLRYDRMIEEALRGVVRRSLRIVANTGLPGSHHFYITFRTHADGVEIADYLQERYPQEMTIVLQYQFWALDVTDETFAVTLSFNDVHERLVIPFSAITAFADPAAKFALQFQQATGADAVGEADGGDAVEGGKAKARPAPRLDIAKAESGKGDAGKGETGKGDSAPTPLPVVAKAPAAKPAAKTSDDVKPADAAAGDGSHAKDEGGNNIVTLDQFRRK